MVRSRAMRARESGQVRKEAALSGSEQATRIGLTGASHGENAREPPSKAGPHGPLPETVARARKPALCATIRSLGEAES